jgi:glycosyltransferase involved in cell wall biosynthesis
MIDVSIIITAYNYEHYIEECLESCINQEGGVVCSYEVIVVDDGSSDDTLKKAKQYESDMVRVFTKENGGIEEAANFGIRKSRGNYIARVDADDKLTSRYLSVLYPVIEEDEGKDFVYADYSILDKDSNVIEEIRLPEFDADEIRQRGDFQATGTLFRRNALEAVNFFSVHTRNCGLENYELIIKLLQNGATGKHVDELLFYYRRHETNFSEVRRKQIINYGKKLFREYGLGAYRTNQYHPYKLKL